MIRHCCHCNRRNTLYIDSTWCLKSYSMHNFSFILFRIIHTVFEVKIVYIMRTVFFVWHIFCLGNTVVEVCRRRFPYINFDKLWESLRKVRNEIFSVYSNKTGYINKLMFHLMFGCIMTFEISTYVLKNQISPMLYILILHFI